MPKDIEAETNRLAELDKLLEQVTSVQRDPEADWTETDILDLIGKANDLEQSLSKSSKDAASQSVDPQLDRHAAREARNASEDTWHDMLRAQAAGKALDDVLQSRMAAIKQRRQIEAYDRAAAASQACADRIKSEWPELKDKMVNLLAEIAAVNLQIDATNANLPEGKQGLIRPEGIAGGFDDDFVYQAPRTVNEFRLVQTMLPVRPGSNNFAWPPNTNFTQAIINGNKTPFSVDEVMRKARES